ncbi:hypothetical protein TSOC_006876 [Tetrabaena socialis]|uniref:Uncharacterized protein n=1 Tax=Tetrabaena socialis TaxID=47790 RepID=A0A2J8A2F8_9CHLO|nr:hypothetical protein TSOC_006876 [Tetrabaena socialis]|eukprot:PNH06707.1 hypothetical protein TSOC_006876 [Tetrabaena socialis]
MDPAPGPGAQHDSSFGDVGETGLAAHPLALELAQLETLQQRLFLAVPARITDAGPQQRTEEEVSAYHGLACNALACCVSSCELWRNVVLQIGVARGGTAGGEPELSAPELGRLLAHLLSSLHVLDCLKDAKQQALQAVLGAPNGAGAARSEEEMQLLAAVQYFVAMPSACVRLLRDLLLEDGATLGRARRALLHLLPGQLEAVEAAAALGQGGEAVRGSAGAGGSKRGGGRSRGPQALGSSQAGGLEGGGGGGGEGPCAARSVDRIALALMVHLYCCLDSAEQAQPQVELSLQPQPPQQDGADASLTPSGAKAAAAANQRLLLSCVTALRVAPVVPAPGCGGLPVDLARLLQDLPQLAHAVSPWEAAPAIDEAAAEERYGLSAATAAAARDYGRAVEALLALRLRHEAALHEAAAAAEAAEEGGPAAAGAGQAGLGRPAAALAQQALLLLEDWQASLLQLDAFRTWQRQQRAAAEAAGRSASGSAASMAEDGPSRCAFRASDMPDVVRMLSYIKGLHGLLRAELAWLEPLLRVHCTAHLGQLLRAVVVPLAQGVLGGGGAAPQGQLPAQAQLALDGPLSAPASARAGAPPGPFAFASASSPHDPSAVALGLGRLWKSKAASRGRNPDAPIPPPSGLPTAFAPGPGPDTTPRDLSAAAWAPDDAGASECWTPSKSAEFQPDPYTRLRDWFARVSPEADPAAAASALAASTDLGGPLAPVPEGATPRSDRSVTAGTAARGVPARQTAAAGGGWGSGGEASAWAERAAVQRPGSSGARPQQTPRTEGTEEGAGVECTVSSVSSDAGGRAASVLELDAERRGGYGSYGPAGDGGGAYDSGAEGQAEEEEAPRSARPCWRPQQQEPQQHLQHLQLGLQRQPSPPPPSWPQLPVAPVSWLDAGLGGGGTPDFAGSARASTGGRRTSSPALSVNPLYVHASAQAALAAAAERASEGGTLPQLQQQPGTVAIWIAGGGGGEQEACEGGGVEGQQPQGKPASRFKKLKKLFGKRPSASGSAAPAASRDSRGGASGAGAHGTAEHKASAEEAAAAAYRQQALYGTGALAALPAAYFSHPHYFGSIQTEREAGGELEAGGEVEAGGRDAAEQYSVAASYRDYYTGGGGGHGNNRGSVASADWPLPSAEVVAEAAVAHEGAVALLSVGPSEYEQQQQAAQRPGGKGLAFLAVVQRAAEGQSCGRLQELAKEMEACLAATGMAPAAAAAAGPQLPDTEAAGGFSGFAPGGAAARGSGGAKGGLKRLFTSLRSKGGGRTGGGDARALHASYDAAWAQEQHRQPQGLAGAPEEGWGVGEARVARMRCVAELMAAELDALLALRRSRGKVKDGPPVVQLLALASELRAFLDCGLPALAPLLAFAPRLAAAADLSQLVLLPLSQHPQQPQQPVGRSAGPVASFAVGGPKMTLASEILVDDGVKRRAAARSGAMQQQQQQDGGLPWELVRRGVLAAAAGGGGSGAGLPLRAAMTVMSLFQDAEAALRACAPVVGEPASSQLLWALQRQARCSFEGFVAAAAETVWATYKAQAVRRELGLPVPPGSRGVASCTAGDAAGEAGQQQQPERHQHAWEEEQELGVLAAAGISFGSPLAELLSVELQRMVRAAAQRVAAELLSSDLTALLAVKQQLDVLSSAVARLRRDLPSIPPWPAVWLAALLPAAAASPTCMAVAEHAAATAAAGGLAAEDVLAAHVCSAAVLRALCTWSYDMAGARFRPTKHTKRMWDGVFAGEEACHLLAAARADHPDGADLVMAGAAGAEAGAPGSRGGGRGGGGGGPSFGRPQLLALHSLLGLDGVGRLVAALRRQAAEVLEAAAPLLRRVHERYDGSAAGPRGPGPRGAGGAAGFLTLQQRWMRERGHNEMLVSAHRAMQAVGNSVAAVALVDGVLAELCAVRGPHLLPLVASAQQADQQAYAALQAMAKAGLLLGPLAGAAPGGPQLPPGLAGAEQPAVAAAALVQERLRQQLPPAFGLPG